MSTVTNPGSAIGELIGSLLEKEIHRIIKPIAEARGFIYIDKGSLNPKTGKHKKLILTDKEGNDYNVDSIIINYRLQPLVLLESKYIRYTKHNRDKASWICTAHSKLRERYQTVRKSIAILMGNWSRPSKKMLRSFEVEIFEIPFENICNVLARHNISYNWQEKERQKAIESWQRIRQLQASELAQISKELIASIEDQLKVSLEEILDESYSREIALIKVVIRSNLGETYTYTFSNLQEAVEFLEAFTDANMDTLSSPAVLRDSTEVQVVQQEIDSSESDEIDEADEFELDKSDVNEVFEVLAQVDASDEIDEQ
ncbi:MAG: hypothetical protein Fur006_20600 [Coleofasciculaceae cyanobacterium]